MIGKKGAREKMSVYSIPVTLGIDEEKIEEKIAADIEKHVTSEIRKKIDKTLFESPFYSEKPKIEQIAREEVVKILERNEQEIIDKAAEMLADKLSRSKAVKEAAAGIAKKVKE